VDPTYDGDAESYRDTIRAFLAEHLPAGWQGIGALGEEEREQFIADWRALLADHHLLAVSWPKEYGGAGLSEVERIVLAEEFARAGVPEGSENDGFSITMVGNAIIECGTEEQKRHFLPRIISGEDVWCQGYSEPDAGSDLANLGTRAVLDGDEWVINGQKIWTSSGHKANWVFVLCRTAPAEAKHRGISFILVPMDQPGVEVRPIININNRHDFNEVFFTDAKARKEDVVGDVNDGWRVANVLLGFERGHGATTDAVRFREELDRVTAVARERGATEDPLTRQDLARAHTTVEIMRWMGQRTVTNVLAGNAPGPESSIHKLLWSEHHNWFTERTMHILGAEAMTPSGHGAVNGINTDAIGAEFSSRAWVQTFLGARPGTIYAGTSQVQRNIVGDRVLGLPREPRADAGPWNEIGKS
jgi:alkylation response protein AidB-like acyl-CoA dehydrogenase